MGQLWSMLRRLLAHAKQQQAWALLPCTSVASVGFSMQITHTSASSAHESAAESIDASEALEPWAASDEEEAARAI